VKITDPIGGVFFFLSGVRGIPPRVKVLSSRISPGSGFTSAQFEVDDRNGVLIFTVLGRMVAIYLRRRSAAAVVHSPALLLTLTGSTVRPDFFLNDFLLLGV